MFSKQTKSNQLPCSWRAKGIPELSTNSPEPGAQVLSSFSPYFLKYLCFVPVKTKSFLTGSKSEIKIPGGYWETSCSLISTSLIRGEQRAVSAQVLTANWSSMPSLISDFPLDWQSLQHIWEERGNCLSQGVSQDPSSRERLGNSNNTGEAGLWTPQLHRMVQRLGPLQMECKLLGCEEQTLPMTFLSAASVSSSAKSTCLVQWASANISKCALTHTWFVYSMVGWRKERCTHPSRPWTSWSSLPGGAAQNLLGIKGNPGGASVVNGPGIAHEEASLPGCTQIPATRWHLCAQFRKGKALGRWTAGKSWAPRWCSPGPFCSGLPLIVPSLSCIFYKHHCSTYSQAVSSSGE